MTKILLVEDDKSLREIYGVRLLAEGFDIVSAGDGEEALAMAIKEKPTLIISDVMMPKISGFDMLDILRSTTETRDIKVIMMTALSSDDQRTRGEQLGADRYLVKSQVGIEDVVRTVHEVLGDTPGTAAAAPATAAAIPAPTAEPVAAPSDATPVTDASAPVADDSGSLASTVPGNDAAGPLPPQPTEPIAATEPVESTLPQPTAPFTSPRPANLGERVIQPLESAEDTGATAEAIARELQASAEPVANTQVDDAISDTDVANDTSPANEFTVPQPAVETTPEPVAEPATPSLPDASNSVNLDVAPEPVTPEAPVEATSPAPLPVEESDDSTPTTTVA